WLVLMKAHRTLERLATRSIELSEVGLSDFAVMEMLLHKGPQPVNEIGRRVELTSGAITTAVDRLESRALVTRGGHPRDPRARTANHPSWRNWCAKLHESAAPPRTISRTSRTSAFRASTNRCRPRWASIKSGTRSGGPRRLHRWTHSSSSRLSTTTVFRRR